MGIRVENLVKSYGPDRVLDGIDLEVPDRSFFSVVAPTGSGKTTLLRIMTGVEEFDSGSVYYDDRDMSEVPVQQRSVGMVYQKFINYPSLTVHENIASPLEVSDRDLPRDEIDRRVRETAEMLRIDHILDHLPEEVSGGEAQRTAIARALVKQPDYLFMDEPLANLDYKLREQLRSDFKRLFSERDTTVIYATPDAGDALSMSTHIGFLHGGKIIQDGPTREIYHAPRHLPVAEYLGVPPMNTLPARLTEENGHRFFLLDGETKIDAEGFEELDSDRDFVVGFRPQDMETEETEASEVLSTTVSFTETVGSTSTLHLDFQGHDIYFLNDRPSRHEPGSSMIFRINPDKLYVYDAESEQLLTRGGAIPDG